MSNANERNRNSVAAAIRHPHRHKRPSPPPTPKASDALPLPLYLTDTIFFTLFFSIAYYLLHRWRDNIRTSTPLHVVTLSEITTIVSLIASFIYLLGFFGIDFVHSLSLSIPLKNPNNPETLETPVEREPPKKLPRKESAIVN